jgi:hypothetical protein
MGPIFSKTTNSTEVNQTEDGFIMETVIDIEPPEIIPPMERESADVVILDLKKKGYDAMPTALHKNDLNDISNALMSIIQNGADEFKERTGRPMSYAEMRAAWG